MTGLAGHAAAIVIFLVAGKAESRQFFVVDIGVSQPGDDRIAALMFYMAGLAAVCTWQTAMKTGCSRPLAGDFDVAILAAGIGDAVHGGMAVTALVFELSVRYITGGNHCRLTGKGRQRTRNEGLHQLLPEPKEDQQTDQKPASQSDSK